MSARCAHGMPQGLCVVAHCPHYDGAHRPRPVPLVRDGVTLPEPPRPLPPFLDVTPRQAEIAARIDAALVREPTAKPGPKAGIRSCPAPVLTDALRNALANSLELQARAEAYALAELTRPAARKAGAA